MIVLFLEVVYSELHDLLVVIDLLILDLLCLSDVFSRFLMLLYQLLSVTL